MLWNTRKLGARGTFDWETYNNQASVCPSHYVSLKPCFVKKRSSHKQSVLREEKNSGKLMFSYFESGAQSANETFTDHLHPIRITFGGNPDYCS